MDIRRWLDDQPSDYPEAHLKLIDALRDYIRSNETLGSGLLLEESITRAEYDAGLLALCPMRDMLADLEKHGLDPTLGLKSRRGK